jgi:mRNA interferase RelE/StbE
MTYDVVFKPRSLKDLKSLPKSMRQRIMEKIEALRNDLAGDVRRLTDMTPEYRLRVGDYRVLFEVEEAQVIVYRVVNRKDAY